MVLAPRSGLAAKSIERRTMAPKIAPSLWPRPVATKPGCRQFAVTPVPVRRRASSRVNRMLASLRASIRCHGAIIRFHLQVIEIEEIALMGTRRGRRGIDNARRRRCYETLAQ